MNNLQQIQWHMSLKNWFFLLVVLLSPGFLLSYVGNAQTMGAKPVTHQASHSMVLTTTQVITGTNNLLLNQNESPPFTELNRPIADPQLYIPIIFKTFDQKPLECDYRIGLNVTRIDGRENFRNLRPGQIVCLEAGRRNYLRIKNISGEAEQPIIFINVGGQAVFRTTRADNAITVENSQHFQITGTGVPGIEYGIKIVHAPLHGIRVGRRSSHFEIDHVEISGVYREGIASQTVPVCPDGSTNNYDYDNDGKIKGDRDDVITRDTFVQRQMSIHHNYIYDVGTEGMYLGSSFFREGKRMTCSGKTMYVFPPVLRGVKVFANRVENTGWEAIQVSSADRNCQIYRNTVIGDSTKDNISQQSGIFSGNGNACDVYQNLVIDSGGAGIYMFGEGPNRVFNNFIIRPGQNRNRKSSGITVRNVQNDPVSSVYVWHNTIVDSTANGIIFGGNPGADNRAQNNLIVAPEAAETEGSSGYIKIGTASAVLASDNLFLSRISEARFAAPEDDNFALRSGSPAIDAGVDLGENSINRDYFGNVRPKQIRPDAGAHEF